MGRPAKNGKFANFYMAKNLLNDFETVSKIVGKTKTAVIEELLKDYLEQFRDTNGKIYSRKAVYLKTGHHCQVLDELIINDRKFYKIYYDGDILNVPVGDVVI